MALPHLNTNFVLHQTYDRIYSVTVTLTRVCVAGAKPAGKAAAKAAAAVVAETKAAAARAVVQPSGPSAVKKPAAKKSRKVRGGEAASGLLAGCGQLMRGCHHKCSRVPACLQR